MSPTDQAADELIKAGIHFVSAGEMVVPNSVVSTNPKDHDRRKILLQRGLDLIRRGADLLMEEQGCASPQPNSPPSAPEAAKPTAPAAAASGGAKKGKRGAPAKLEDKPETSPVSV